LRLWVGGRPLGKMTDAEVFKHQGCKGAWRGERSVGSSGCRARAVGVMQLLHVLLWVQLPTRQGVQLMHCSGR
jgi:hypothetical protein